MDVRQFDADVIVVGGGPAGSAAAIGCAERGLRTVLFERDAFARERPGETLHPGIEPLLKQLGIGDRLERAVGARHTGIWIEWGGARRFEPFGADESGPWAGFQVWRQDFDALLLERAGELGVDVRQPSAVTGALIGTGGCEGVRTQDGTVTARMTIDATGRTRWLARALGIASPPRSPSLFARYGYVQGSCPARDEAPALTGDAGGWTWTARVRPNIYQWTRLVFDGGKPEAEWLPEELRGLTAMAPARGADVTWRMAQRVAGPGWFIAGDAAAILDPTSSHGVLKAIMSGMMAAHMAAAVLHGAAPAAETAGAYQDWLGSWFEADAARLTQFYRDLGVPGFG